MKLREYICHVTKWLSIATNLENPLFSPRLNLDSINSAFLPVGTFIGMALNFVNHRNHDGMESVLEHVLLEDCKMNAKMLLIIFFICAKDPSCGILLGFGPGLLVNLFVCTMNLQLNNLFSTLFTDTLCYKHLQEWLLIDGVRSLLQRNVSMSAN